MIKELIVEITITVVAFYLTEIIKKRIKSKEKEE